MKVAVAGASGLIGTALVHELRSHGHEVVRLVRRVPSAPDEVEWEPSAGLLNPSALAGVQGAINLAGAGVGDHRWTDSYKALILSSRVDSTATLSRALARLDPRPLALVNASGEGIYGQDRGDELLTETSPPGSGFLADVVRAWEAATGPAQDAGIRVALARTGLVMSHRGGTMGRMLPLFRLGVAGPLGSGRQWWSHISLRDEVAALRHLLETPTAIGAFHVAAPHPARNADFTAAVARAVNRPAALKVPSFALRIALGEFAGDALSNIRLSTERLQASGFTAADPDAAAVAARVLVD